MFVKKEVTVLWMYHEGINVKHVAFQNVWKPICDEKVSLILFKHFNHHQHQISSLLLQVKCLFFNVHFADVFPEHSIKSVTHSIFLFSICYNHFQLVSLSLLFVSVSYTYYNRKYLHNAMEIEQQYCFFIVFKMEEQKGSVCECLRYIDLKVKCPHRC